MLQPKKPKFDPTKAYEVVDNNETAVNAKPKFDPSKPFDVVKKKESTDSTSTTVEQNSDSVPTDGSLDSAKYEYKPVVDERGREVYEQDASGNLVPKKEKVLKGYASSTEERKIVFQQNREKAKKSIKPSVNLEKYQQATSIPEEEFNQIESEIDDELNQRGFTNGLTTGLKKGANFLSNVFTTIGTFGTETKGPNFDIVPFTKEQKKAEELLTEKYKGDSSKITDTELKEATKNIVLENRIEGVKIDKNNQFLKTLSEDDKRALELERIEQYKTISDRDKYYFTEAALLVNETEKLAKDYNITKAIVENNKKQNIQTPKELIDFGMELESKLQSSISMAAELENKISDNDNQLGSAEEEIDFLKRNYSTKDKFINNIKLGFGDLWMNVSNDLPLLIEELDSMIFEPLRPGSKSGIMTQEEKNQFINDAIDWESAKEKTRSKIKKDVTFENLDLSNFGQFFFQELGTQVPIFAQIALPGGIASIGMTSSSDKFVQMEMESNQIEFKANGKKYSGYQKQDGTIVSSDGFEFVNDENLEITSDRKKDYTPAQMISTAVGFGTAEAVLGALPTKGILNRSVQAIERAGQRQLLRESGKQYIKGKLTGIVKDAPLEAVSEGLTQVNQNFLDKAILGKKEVGLFDNVSHASFSGGMLGGAISVMPTVAGLIMRPFADNKQSKVVRDNLESIFNLQEQLNNSNISESSRNAINDKITTLESQNKDLLKSISKDAEKISEEVFNAVVDVNKKQELLKLQAAEIKADASLDKTIKSELIADLESEFNLLETKRSKLISKDVTVLDTLPESEVIKLKNKASKELITKAKAEGKTEFNFEDAEITKKAISIYNENKTQTSLPTSPEVVAPSVVSNDSQINEVNDNAVVEDNNEVIPNPSQINNEAAPENITPTNEGVQPGINPMGEVLPEDQANDNQDIPAAVDSGTNEVDFNERDEFDALLSGEAEQRRKDGRYTRDGVEYVRQEPKETPKGKKATVKFADEVEVDAEYTLMEANEVQPSHLNGKRNPDFFITEAQPKNRKDSSSIQASDKIGKNPKLNEVGENSNAYSGAPVVNERGEVIQGNNRAEGLKKHYKNKGVSYKQQLIENAEQFGLTSEQVEAMDNPVLVRKVKADDARAIQLGNFDVKDIETGGTRRIDPVATSRRIPSKEKATLMEILFGSNDNVTLNESLRKKLDPVINILKKYLNQAQIEGIISKDGQPKQKGIEDLENLIQHFLFENGNVNLAEQFESLSSRAKNGIFKSLPKILSLPSSKSLLTELQNAIGAVHSFVNSGNTDFNSWVEQVDMFLGQTPSEIYSELEIEIANILINAKTESTIKATFADYNELVTGKEADMFTEKTEPISKKEAIEKKFNIKQNESKPAEQIESPTPSNEQAGIENNEGNAGRAEAEAKPDEEVKPLTVRSLAEMQEGEVSAAVFSSLNKGDVFTVSGKKYEVTAKTKESKKSFVSKKTGETINYTESKITTKEIKKEGYGKPITSVLWTYENGNSNWHGASSNNLHEQLSRDIEGDITTDLINENNPFHTTSDSYILAEKTVNSINNQEVKPPSKDSTADELLNWIDKARKDLDDFEKGNLSSVIGMPVPLAKLALDAMRLAVIAGKKFSEVIQAGLDVVKNSQWYQNLTTTEQKEVEDNFIQSLSDNNRQVQNAVNRAFSDSMTEEEAFDKFNETTDNSDKLLENKKTAKEVLRNFYRSFVKRFTDRQYTAKRLLDKSGLSKTKNLIINSHGASGKAKMVFEEAYNTIYKKLTRKDRKMLDKIIQAKRFIAIDNNREARGLEPVSHPDFIDKGISQKFLDKLKKEIGDQKFADLENRANEYFKVYKKLLKDIYDNGLINKESYDSMSDIDYQPRVFLQFVTDFNGDLSEGNKNVKDSGGLSQDQVKSMSEGDASALVLNSEWLLMNSLLARTKAMANNNINKRFMTDEFPKAKKRFDAIDPKNFKNKEEKRFYNYFKELNEKVKDNPIVGFTDSGNPKYSYDKAPLNFKTMYYYVDGVQNRFFLENELHDSWNDNLDGFLSGNAKEMISYASGSAMVKAIATGNNPAFPIVNTPRDFFFTVTFSDQYSNNVLKGMVQVAKDVGKAILAIKNDDAIVQKYFEYGGAMDFLSSQGTLKKESLLGKAIDKAVSPKSKDIAKSIFDKATLRKISTYSELMFRIGIFQRSINNQLKDLGFKDISEVTDTQQVDDIYNQAVASARGILDFNQGGSVTKDLEAFIPYINVAFQGGRTAINAFEKDPVGTTSRILQVATIGSTIPIGISLMLIGANKDDDDERSNYEIYVDAIDGVSPYQKSRYMTIFTGQKDEEGQYRYIKIAKSQELTPFMSITDNIYQNMIRSLAGREKRSAKLIASDAAFVFRSNVLPVDVSSPSAFITRNPVIKAVLTYATGYDFFREQPLDFNLEARPSASEGMNRKDVEDFYKKLGVEYGLSPIRSKAFVESLITSPNTNPFVGVLYGGAEAVTFDKDFLEIGKKLGQDIYKSTGKRVVGYTSDFNRQLETKKQLEEKIEKVKLEDAIQKKEFKELAEQFLNKEITTEEVKGKLKDLEPDDKKRFLNKLKDKVKIKDVDGTVLDIKYERSPEIKALMIVHYYGDIFDGTEESKRIYMQMKKAGGIITPSVMKEIKKLKQEITNKKTSN